MTEPTRAAPVVTVVRTPACHFCEDALTALDELRREVPLRLDVVAAADPRGRDLLGRHRPGMFPLVLVDGAFFSAGRLPRTKLRSLLAARQTAQVS